MYKIIGFLRNYLRSRQTYIFATMIGEKKKEVLSKSYIHSEHSKKIDHLINSVLLQNITDFINCQKYLKLHYYYYFFVVVVDFVT